MSQNYPLFRRPPKSKVRESLELLHHARTAMYEAPSGDECATFLAHVEGIQESLGIAKAPRSYRSQFSRNYRQLLRDEKRRYRVDLLEAALEKPDPLFVNDTRFDWGAPVTSKANALEAAWERLLAAIGDQDERGLVRVLERFDVEFAGFEKEYLFFLIQAETSCKAIVQTAVEQAQAVRLGGAKAESELVATLCELNGRANVHGKGRQDLGLDILETARFHRDGALGVLCGRVLSSFEEAVEYFESVGAAADGLDRIDPQLARNERLGAVLAEWEEAWEAGKRYLCEPRIRETMGCFVADLRQVADVVPRFNDMLNSSDVEVFALVPQMFVAFCAAGQMGGRELLVLVCDCEDIDLAELPVPSDGHLATMAAIAGGEEQPALMEAGFMVQRRNAPSWNLFLGALAREVLGTGP